MKFLLRLVLTGGLMGAITAAPHESKAMTLPSGNLSVTDENTKNTPQPIDGNLINDLNHTLSITNPYSSSADQPFEIVESKEEVTAPLATRVYCGGYYWNDGELLGTNGDGEVRTAIIHDRIYIRIGGNIASNKFHLLHAAGTPFPNNSANDALLHRCVNNLDPSTFTNGYLGPLENGVIKCNNKSITNNLLLGTFWGDGVATEQYAVISNGLLRVVAWRRDGRAYNPQGFNDSVLGDIIKGENGHSLNPNLGFTLNMNEINSCFWKDLPIYPEADPAVNCAAGPTLMGPTNITKTDLTFSYSGTGVNTIKWRILQDGNVKAQATTGNVSSSTNISISYGSSLPAGDYRLEIQGGNCISSTSSLIFTITEPVVVTPACQNGPTISSIRNITPSSLNVDFAASNLHVFSWRILDGTYPVASGKTDYLNSNTASLVFNYLNNGSYTFEITPEDCIAPSTTVQNFSVSSSDTRAGCPKGPTVEQVIASSSTSLSFLFDGAEIYAIDWKIMDGNTMLRQNRVAPTSNRPAIQYETLPTGVYTLQITGGNCKSTSSARQFGVNVALPIHISEFKGAVVEKGVELSWKVLSEKDGESFEILRYGEDDKTSEVIGKVSLTDARLGLYKFVDESPLLGINYYQLKQNDTDGTFTKSRIISINPGLISETLVAPNPASDYVNIQFSSRNTAVSNIDIYNVSGIKVSSSQIKITEGKNLHRIHVGKLTEGNYFIKLSNGTAEAAKLRFVKAN